MPDTVNLIIWLIAGLAGGFAVGDLLKGDFDLGPTQSAPAGAVGGVIGAKIFQLLIPSFIPIVGQIIAAAASGAALTVVIGAVIRRRQRR